LLLLKGLLSRKRDVRKGNGRTHSVENVKIVVCW
jgi:hypothetical protein